MDFHGITMKGKYYAEQVTSPTGADTIGRIVVNTSTTANGVADNKAQNKLFFNDGAYWLRPLVANADDRPDQDNQWDLGISISAGDSANRRWRNINAVNFYGVNFYGQVRYS
jgi:hypothetical protein